jgi:hypothetical protein
MKTPELSKETKDTIAWLRSDEGLYWSQHRSALFNASRHSQGSFGEIKEDHKDAECLMALGCADCEHLEEKAWEDPDQDYAQFGLNSRPDVETAWLEVWTGEYGLEENYNQKESD